MELAVKYRGVAAKTAPQSHDEEEPPSFAGHVAAAAVSGVIILSSPYLDRVN